MGVVCAVLALGTGTALGAFADDEPRTFSKTNERYQYLTGTPAYQAQLRQKGLRGPGRPAGHRRRHERSPFRSLCFTHQDGCAGDVRLYDWDKQAGNIRTPVLWTARSGATISGHVWTVAGGQARKPGVVITNGSVQAPEQLYWLQAAALARAGFVVLTWDPQTQGRSDSSGAAPTESENATPQSVGAFTDGTVDALDFMTSTPGSPFRPRNSTTNPAVNHGAKQARRVAEGRNAGFNPLHGVLDPTGWAWRATRSGPRPCPRSRPRTSGWTRWWPGTSWRSKEPQPRVPGLGMSGDYGIGSPNGAVGVNPKAARVRARSAGRNGPSRAFSTAGGRPRRSTPAPAPTSSRP